MKLKEGMELQCESAKKGIKSTGRRYCISLAESISGELEVIKSQGSDEMISILRENAEKVFIEKSRENTEGAVFGVVLDYLRWYCGGDLLVWYNENGYSMLNNHFWKRDK